MTEQDAVDRLRRGDIGGLEYLVRRRTVKRRRGESRSDGSWPVGSPKCLGLSKKTVSAVRSVR